MLHASDLQSSGEFVMPDGQSKAVIDQEQTLKNVVCTSCDGFCPVAVKVDDGQAVKVTTRDHPLLKDVLCCLLYTSPSPRDS